MIEMYPQNLRVDLFRRKINFDDNGCYIIIRALVVDHISHNLRDIVVGVCHWRVQ